jgi:hypothetical protein
MFWASNDPGHVSQDVTQGQVLHRLRMRYRGVTKSLRKSEICRVAKIISIYFNALTNRLNFRQITEAGQNAGKFRMTGNLPPQLSTETVDASALVIPPVLVQQIRGIEG